MLLPHAGRDGSRWVGRQHWDKKTKGTQAKYHLLTWPGGSKWQLGTWGALQYAQQHAAESQLYTSLMLLVGAGVHTLVLSGRWKIESCFSLSVSSSNAFCSMKKKKLFSIIFQFFQYFLQLASWMLKIFLCRERAGAQSIIQMLNKWLFYRVVL